MLEAMLGPCKPLSFLTCRQGPHGGDWVRHRRHRHWRRQEAEGEVPGVQGKLRGRDAHQQAVVAPLAFPPCAF